MQKFLVVDGATQQLALRQTAVRNRMAVMAVEKDFIGCNGPATWDRNCHPKCRLIGVRPCGGTGGWSGKFAC